LVPARSWGVLNPEVVHEGARSVLAIRGQLRLAAGLMLVLGGQSFAQEANVTADNNEVAEVLVTGSRIQRNGYSAPTPTTIVGADRIEQEGATNVLEVLNEQPSFKASTTPQTNGIRAATPGSSYADLRGLGQTRTLVLVDGKRFVPQIATVLNTYQVDLNQVPAIMLDRVEVVTGGASAQWGSDAVAGVVNLVTKKNFEGLQSEVQAGESRYGDDQEFRAAVLGGTSLMDHRLHLEAAFDYDHNNGVGDVFTRPWGRQGYQILSNPCPLAAAVSAACPHGGNGQAQQLILPDVRYSTLTNGGIILNTALKGTQFGPGGVPMAFLNGNYAGSSNMQGGDAVNAGNNINTGVSLEDWVKRQVAFGRLAFDINDNLQFHLEGSFSDAAGGGQSLPPRDTGALVTTIARDNPYIPAATLALMNADNINSFQLGRNDADIDRQQSRQDNTTARIVVGFEGTVFNNWNWDAAYVYGYNRYSLRDQGNRIVATYRMAADAVLNSATGQVVCRSSLTNPNNGCVPLDLFGYGAPSAAAISYVTGTASQRTNYRQDDVSANLRGEPVDTWAGPVSLALGFEYRNEQQTSHQDAISLAQGFEGTNSLPIDGSFNVKEGYLETVVPLAKDLPFARSLDFNGAVREEGYSTSAGRQTTWKAGLTYKPVEDLLLRVVRSRDIRAPNIYELQSLPLANQNNIIFGNQQVSVYSVQSGNSKLLPEVGDTFSAGFAYTPSFIPRLQVSLDYYDIDLTRAIGALTQQQVANFCALGSAAQKTAYCPLITFDAAGVPLSVQAPYLNLGESIRKGFELNAAYRLPLDTLAHSLPGALSFDLQGNYYEHFQQDLGTGLIERAGDQQGSPKLMASGTVGYEVGPFSISALVRYIGASKYDNTFIEGVTINDNSVPSVTYVNFMADYNVSDHFQVFGVIRNAFDRAPPPVPTSFGYPTTAAFYDMVGQTWRLGFRYKY
jgi:iron complex outermembrane recepter protein